MGNLYLMNSIMNLLLFFTLSTCVIVILIEYPDKVNDLILQLKF